jgi:hypothetical protein
MRKKRISNPYWKEIRRFVTETGTLPRTYDDSRWKYCNQYTWAIPDPETVRFVSGHLGTCAIEIGAGSGYWAWLLAQHGIDILAYDTAPPNSVSTNEWHSPWDADTGTFLHQLRETFYPVELGGPEQAAQHAERTLFLCWPPYKKDMALQCLKCFTGERCVYIGEGRGGCCANNAFFAQLEKGWQVVAQHWPVSWYNIHDGIYVYERKRRRGRR